MAMLSCALLASVAGVGLFAVAPRASAYFDCPPLADTCAGRDQGGTAQLPAVQCSWGNPVDAPMQIIDGLPPGVTLDCEFRVHSFFDVFVSGDPLTGMQEQFQCSLLLHMNGSGPLSNFHRTITIPLQCTSSSGPRTPGEPVQTFDTEMLFLSGQAGGGGTGDPDFDLLRITGGGGFGMPSPGHTTLTRLPSGHWAVDSFFDITYRIDFIGRPGSPLGGMSGSTTGTIRMSNAQHSYGDVCAAPIVQTPIGPVPPMPSPCPMKGDDSQEMVMLNGLPPGSPIRCRAAIEGTNLLSVGPGGTLGGTTHGGTTNLVLHMQGEGALSSFTRDLAFVCSIETSLAPVSPTAPTQKVSLQLDLLGGEFAIPGDRDFDLLRVSAGGSFGLPSPGHTTLTKLPGDNWAVDSFFDITYRIDFVGHSPGPLAGMSGSTTGTIRMSQGIEYPALHEDFCGLEHVALGTITLTNEPNPADTARRRLTACCIGSSGQDGVEVQLMAKPGSGGGGAGGSIVEAPAQGHRCELDWVPDGTPTEGLEHMPQGAGLRISSFFDVFYGDLDIERGVHLDLVGMDGTQTQMGVSVFGFDPVPITVSSILKLDGTPVTPPHVMPPSSQMVLGGFATSQAEGLVVQHRLCCDGDGDGLPDILEITITNPFDAVCSFPGEPTVTADQAVLRVSLNGLPPGTRYIGLDRMRMKTLSLSTLHLHQEHIIHRDLAARIRESPTRGPRKGVRVATGDVNGDGAADLMVSGLNDPNLTDEMVIIEADLDGDGEFEPLSHMQCSTRFGIGSLEPMPPNGRLRASFFDIFVGDDVWVEARRCADGTCTTTEMTADFSACGATTLRVRAYDGPALVADISGIPMGAFAVVGAEMASPVTVTGQQVSSGAMRCDWSWGKSNRGTIHHGSGGGLAGGWVAAIFDRLVIEPESPTIPIELSSMSLWSSNLCPILLTDLQGSALAPCPADIMPPGGNHVVNTDDLIVIITSWGPCINGCDVCPADIVRDCTVNTDDLVQLIGSWGNCPGVIARTAVPPSNAPRPPPAPPSEPTPPRPGRDGKR